MALFFEGRSPEKNSAISVTEESIILAGNSKRVHGIFDLYPTKITREKMHTKIDFKKSTSQGNAAFAHFVLAARALALA